MEILRSGLSRNLNSDARGLAALIARPKMDVDGDAEPDAEAEAKAILPADVSIDDKPIPQFQQQLAMKNVVQSSQDSEVLAMQIRTRGPEMAEARRKQQRIELGLDPLEGRKRRSLDEIMGKGKQKENQEKEREQEVVERQSDRRREVGEMMEDLAPSNLAEVFNALSDEPNKDVDGGQDNDPENMSYELQYPEEAAEPVQVPIPAINENPPLQINSEPRNVLARTEDNESNESLRLKLTLTNAQLEVHASEIQMLNARVEELLQQNAALQRQLEEATTALSKPPEPEPQPIVDEFRTKIDYLEKDLSSARAAITSAEKDRDLFREQYVKASGYVSEVREENVQLLKRVEIAERQATEGVTLIKASFEERLRVSEEQSSSHLKITEFLMKKDAATDRVRKDAVEAPELRAKIIKLEKDLAEMREEAEQLESAFEVEQLKVEQLERQQEEREAEWKKVVEESQQQVARMMADLNDAKSMQYGDPTTQRVFQCQWRGENAERCLFICETKEQLEDHAIHGGHIKLP
ncbi:hypothetical protein GYMLUDRAFT_464152 [Collybiopsis luxurians FD-317 M1]|uniref:Uncharacterized protein n=1 Tax=Collybiopsis luxurians FD-317 M1 TaxID=944289 RepID=A0A0D0CUQ7_9AGAR|nr:hypothetical protein GYMLUDRAFT_464152 [Collybiopsis luxurians FD-317 M1]